MAVLNRLQAFCSSPPAALERGDRSKDYSKYHPAPAHVAAELVSPELQIAAADADANAGSAPAIGPDPKPG